MQVGDLVTSKMYISADWGIIIQTKGLKIQCLWHNGDKSWCMKHLVEVING